MTKRAAQSPFPVVLIAEDEEPMRQVERRILESAGYRVVEVASGAEALMRVHDEPHVDLLLADIEMPELRGDEAARLIKATRPGLKVLFVTGHTRQLFKTPSTLADDEAYLDKPFTAVGLLEAVSLLLYGTRTPPWQA